ncbi:uncharacterized protein LOC143657073 [Tamandua tetradactyla]|uniref:uncharacterized protein LOC143657073 n=1 Tax=Tamandua tetradactyla TaxID=48850 RepID=UPI004053C45F
MPTASVSSSAPFSALPLASDVRLWPRRADWAIAPCAWRGWLRVPGSLARRSDAWFWAERPYRLCSNYSNVLMYQESSRQHSQFAMDGGGLRAHQLRNRRADGGMCMQWNIERLQEESSCVACKQGTPGTFSSGSGSSDWNRASASPDSRGTSAALRTDPELRRHTGDDSCSAMAILFPPAKNGERKGILLAQGVCWNFTVCILQHVNKTKRGPQVQQRLPWF